MALNPYARYILQQIVERYGPFTSNDEDIRRCRGLLHDLTGAHVLEINLLLRALEVRTPEILGSNNLPTVLSITRLVQELQNTHGISAENARWAVVSWGMALGIPLPAQFKFETTPADTPMAISKINLEWVIVPAGEFLMGSDKSKDGRANDCEMPQRRIYLSEYQIAKFAVTNAQYKLFVDATGYSPPEHWTGGRIPSDKAEHPVVYVSWHDAMTFCTWAGVRLPTEAEWEKAARGTDGRIYPWGDEPSSYNANYLLRVKEELISDTTEVWRHPTGVSPYGILNMSGNVCEWVNDGYQPDYYNISPNNNPSGPNIGELRVLRGGSWRDGFVAVRSASRKYSTPDHKNNNIGFRCARK